MRFPGGQNLSPNMSKCGVVALAVALIASLAATRPAVAQSETVLYNFCSLANCADGKEPLRNIVRDSQGNIYGTTAAGGQFGVGVLYQVSPSGVETVLHHFGSTADDGQGPYGLVADSQGNLYGTTFSGGTHVFQGASGGTAFKMTPDGTYSILYNFGATSTDALHPSAGLTVDAKGNLYGVSEYGGANNYGTIFKLTPTGKETVLHSFNNDRVDGYLPFEELTLDRKGNVWGVSTYGGKRDQGIIFEVSASGVYSIRFNFGSSYSGVGGPESNITFDIAGNLYGTATSYGLAHMGGVYEITRGSTSIWTENVLASFTSSEGFFPEAGVTSDSAGNLYGTAVSGGTSGNGTAYELTSDGQLITLFNFDYTHGSTPDTNLLLDSAGNLYGTTPYGGTSNTTSGGGVLYEITP
ncbi:MAG TPA: choice-of-anchor tandem repeat GloVer-containing protein [Candidatus Sulfotelmatobacter sp.]|nr:choice-of-anchor tandem repeat GloVer-containing protein [Candidatus Sulfotelmatobacter sp.]